MANPLRRLKSVLKTAVGACIATAALFVGSYALVATLPEPPEGERLAAELLARLQKTAGRGGVVHVGGRTVTASCRPIGGRRGLVVFDDGTRLVVRGRRVRTVAVPAGPSTRVLAAQRRTRSLTRAELELVSAKAVLAGPRPLLAIALSYRLVRAKPTFLGATTAVGVPAYAFHVGEGRPRIELVVARSTLTPLVVRYVSRRLRGWAKLRADLAQEGPLRGC